ncbi:MAG: hypothetical protein RLO12_09680 [Fulvivirga sp.]|jgi:hypothetical protein|uniref:hypothetical protein n=1 Tax=Fulvivirga sp. TaxID=1931237 RepID=UPI0032ED9F7E
MLLKDLVVTPILLMIVYLIAYIIKYSLKDSFFKKIFIPALTLKILAAILLGVVYQFYYEGGDTFSYFRQSKVIHEAFSNNPVDGLKLIFSDGTYDADTFNYSSQLKWYRFQTEFTVVKIAAIFGLVCFSTYSGIATFFALFSFAGSWLLFKSLIKINPRLKLEFAIATFFIPSVVFWGSGVLKDSLMIGSLGFLFFGFYNVFIEKKQLLLSAILLFISLYILYITRIYILLGFIPPALLWVFLANNEKIKNPVLRKMAAPVFLTAGIFAAYFLATNITEGNKKYDIDEIAERTKINSEYLYKVSVMQGGSAYNLGKLDGTFGSMFRAAPAAIVVSLFRPFIWEVTNPLMLISSLEATIFLFFTFYIFIKVGPLNIIRLFFADSFLKFCLIFSLIMAFAVGLNSFNFGTLVRYKIPFLPFYMVMLFTLYNKRNSNIIKDV